MSFSRKFYIALAIFFVVSSCSNSSQSNQTLESADESETIAEESDVKEMLVLESPNEIISSYSSIRKSTSQELGEVEIQGDVFWEKDGLWIINIVETWE